MTSFLLYFWDWPRSDQLKDFRERQLCPASPSPEISISWYSYNSLKAIIQIKNRVQEAVRTGSLVKWT